MGGFEVPLAQPSHLDPGQGLRLALDVDAHQGLEQLALAGAHVPGGQPLGGDLAADARGVAGEDVVRRLPGDHRLRPLLAVELGEQVAGQVLLGGQGPQSLALAVTDLGRVGAEEQGRRRHPVPEDGVVQRDVVALEAPAPGPLAADLAEEAHVVELLVAREPTAPAFDFPQDRLQGHDRLRPLVGRRAQPGGHEVQGPGPLGAVHLLDREAGALAGDVVPVGALLLVGEVEARLAPLGLVEGVEEGQGGIGHAAGGVGGGRHVGSSLKGVGDRRW